MIEFLTVDEPTFKAFIAAYPRKLVKNLTTICEPPQLNYNDFERAPYWPDSVVATDTDGRYRIIADINSPVEDDGKRDTDKPLTDRNGVQLAEGDQVDAIWGGSYSPTAGFRDDIRRETILIRDKGTKYEHWSFESCHNFVRGFSMTKA